MSSIRSTSFLNQRPIDGLVLGMVIAVHLLGLVWAASTLDLVEPQVEPPSIAGVLVSPPAPPAPEPPPVAPPAPPTPPAPKPQPAPPKPVTTPTPKPQPQVAKPTPAPIPEPTPAAPSASASAPPDTAAVTPTPPANASAPTGASNAPPREAPVTPPRTDASHLNNPAPDYPAISRRLGEQGRVLLDVHILPDGRVGDIKLNKSSGYARLDNAALAAVRNWRYVPAKRGGEPIAYWYVQPVSFVLN